MVQRFRISGDGGSTQNSLQHDISNTMFMLNDDAANFVSHVGFRISSDGGH
jgi:hypothetical protein